MKQRILTRNLIVSALVATIFLSGCASTGVDMKQPAGTLPVAYTLRYPTGGHLKKVPEEVDIVRRETTQRQVGAQVVVNIALLAVAGGMGVSPFSKNDLKGDEITIDGTREHLRNPVASEFIQRLQHRIDAALQADHALREKSFAQPLQVAGGYARLVYETLLGTDEEQFRLKSDLVVYKRMEKTSIWRPPFVIVDCASASQEPRPESYWAQQDYLPVATELRAALDACEEKVLAALPELLAQ
jgi:hypothetical protein